MLPVSKNLRNPLWLKDLIINTLYTVLRNTQHHFVNNFILPETFLRQVEITKKLAYKGGHL